MTSLCGAFSGLHIGKQAFKAFVPAQHLSARRSAFLCASRPVTVRAPVTASATMAASQLTIECADGRRGGKLKTRKAAVKRYKVTGSGKVLTRKAGKQHLNEKKRHQHLLRCKKEQSVSPGDLFKIKRCIPYAGVK
ncbi:PRPL35 [Auxenochlorella protothecoides x Auxenochlorella symbiontica]